VTERRSAAKATGAIVSRVAHGSEHLPPIGPDHLSGAINDHLRRIDLTKSE
jgi:hypothetical protein